jgi:glycosyltransferase involved in cell wall biosynthesis
MKICLLSRFFNLKTNSGIGRVGIEVRDRLVKRGYAVTALQVNSESHLDYLKYTAWDLRHLPEADIYHCITPMESIHLPKDKSVSTILDLIPILHANKAGARMNLNPVNRLLGSSYFKYAVKQAVKCKHIVTISEETKSDLVRLFDVPENKISVLYPGIREDLEPKESWHPNFTIGYLGQLDHRKRVDLLIKAFKDANINGELLIAGTGPDESKLRELAGTDNRIKFLGFIPDDKICDFYNSIDLFCFPTACEGFGLPLVEAMACKKPVIIFRDSIIPEGIKKRCLIYEDYGFSGAVKLFTLNTNYIFAKSCTWDRYVDGLEKIFKDVLNG